jgi:hypothetical protein
MEPSALIQLLHRYYPSGLWPDDPAYNATEEAQRLTALLASARDDARAWKAFIERLPQEFPDHQIWDATHLWLDPCFNCRIGLPGSQVGGARYDTLVCLLSVLAPVYALYGSHLGNEGPGQDPWPRFSQLPPHFQACEEKLAALIESTFGAERLSQETLTTPVPNLAPRTGDVALGEAKLIDCLFTTHRY